ncbi:MAG: lipid-A-disaccharide synthase [Saprospiraceae bacterium]
MKYYIIAGEASGDLHGANLMKEIIKLDSNATLRYWGGDLMQQVGGTLDQHYRHTAFMGFAEVIKNIFTIFGLFKQCKLQINTFQPDVLILIDYPGFNLRMAKWAKARGLKIVYYITPQVWAWHKSRVHQLGKWTDLLLVILPFEASFFEKYGYQSTFVGHPLLDAIDQFGADPDFVIPLKNGQQILALLPGSRRQEINTILPIMLTGAKNTSDMILIAGAPSIEDAIYETIIHASGLKDRVLLIKNRTYDILNIADRALVASGTATLEAALFFVPQVVCYKGSIFSYMIASRVIDLKYISLVNLIADKEVVKELIQHQLTPENIAKELSVIGEKSKEMKDAYKDIVIKLGEKGASQRAARAIYHLYSTS